MSSAKIKMGSERGFGLVFAGVFLIIALFPLWHGHSVRWWALAASALFLIVAQIHPALLAPLNRLWFRFGLALGKVTTPVVMGLLFAIAVIPSALIMKLFGKDPMHRSLAPDAASYWEPREKQPGPMREQF